MADEIDVKPRKSVAFSEGTIIVDENGEVTMKEDGHDDTKDTAQSHSPSNGDEATANNEDDGLGDLSLMKKKKKKSKKVEEGEEGGDEAAADGGLDLSTMKKKKKSKKPKDSVEDDFTARLAAANLNGDEGEEKVAEETPADNGDMKKGTGIWAHDETKAIGYENLLSRFFILLSEKNPDHASSGSKSYKIPPPQCLREGNKKTIFANIAEICKRMKRTDEHVTQYLFAELGTNGSVDGSRRLVIKGRFQQKQIENVLRKYISTFTFPFFKRYTNTSHSGIRDLQKCRSADTELNKGENRLFFITCNSCGSRRSVTAIKTGFSAQVGKRRRQQG
ncbi:hypothetical protein DID88_006813 [Monilinia fructigena]|uniref:Translation initiation factor IF2/IF5 domain-containing protein n=1 Tax=Monilinia fructigena TaxID=38457 RepID=A0A395IM26_9HELO|nr:hypothetical protein DID88_006813 [Monilinia fructigena]